LLSLPSGRDDHRSCACDSFFLLITRMTSWLRLSRREETWQAAEILLLRHHLTVLRRRQPHRPDLDWAVHPAGSFRPKTAKVE
jgi:hypothetical protein